MQVMTFDKCHMTFMDNTNTDYKKSNARNNKL